MWRGCLFCLLFVNLGFSAGVSAGENGALAARSSGIQEACAWLISAEAQANLVHVRLNPDEKEKLWQLLFSPTGLFSIKAIHYAWKVRAEFHSSVPLADFIIDLFATEDPGMIPDSKRRGMALWGLDDVGVALTQDDIDEGYALGVLLRSNPDFYNGFTTFVSKFSDYLRYESDAVLRGDRQITSKLRVRHLVSVIDSFFSPCLGGCLGGFAGSLLHAPEAILGLVPVGFIAGTALGLMRRWESFRGRRMAEELVLKQKMPQKFADALGITAPRQLPGPSLKAQPLLAMIGPSALEDYRPQLFEEPQELAALLDPFSEMARSAVKVRERLAAPFQDAPALAEIAERIESVRRSEVLEVLGRLTSESKARRALAQSYLQPLRADLLRLRQIAENFTDAPDSKLNVKQNLILSCDNLAASLAQVEKAICERHGVWQSAIFPLVQRVDTETALEPQERALVVQLVEVLRVKSF